eukprot:240901-Prorocentrum_minimum.AAC.11
METRVSTPRVSSACVRKTFGYRRPVRVFGVWKRSCGPSCSAACNMCGRSGRSGGGGRASGALKGGVGGVAHRADFAPLDAKRAPVEDVHANGRHEVAHHPLHGHSVHAGAVGQPLVVQLDHARLTWERQSEGERAIRVTGERVLAVTVWGSVCVRMAYLCWLLMVVWFSSIDRCFAPHVTVVHACV